VPETDPNQSNRGTLVAGDIARQNGVVSQKAYVKLSVTILLGANFWQLVNVAGNLNGGPASAAAKVKFFLNGQPIGRDFIVSATITDPNVPASQSLTRCVAFPTQYLRFARRNDSFGGVCPSSPRSTETTCPGVNELDLRITQVWYGTPSALAAAGGSLSGLFSLPFLALSSPSLAGGILASIGVIPFASSLSFKAIHPVILIHGNSSSDKFWTNQATCSGCDAHWNFEQPFIDQHIPYFDEFNMVNATAEVHYPFLRGRIDVATRRFGAKYVNLVGHSKGGIDSRVWIAKDAALRNDFPVLSLTTVATPHHGSANADYAQNASTVSAMYSDNTFRVLLARKAGTNIGHQSLTTKYGRTLQQENLPLLPRGLSINGDLRRVWYYSFTADANLDSSMDTSGLPTIQYNETIGLNNLAGC
jgi:hypothetical protein